MRQAAASMLLAAFVACAVAGCRKPAPEPAREPAEVAWTAMGTVATLRLAGGEADRLDSQAAVARETFAQLERTLSVYNPESEVSCLNRSAGQAPVPVSGHTRRLLELSRDYAGRSRGCFDITVGPLVRLWGFSGGRRPERVPDDEAIREAMGRTGIAGLELSADGSRAGLRHAGMFVDLGGIAKGYAVDVAWEALAAKGGRDYLLNLGGNMRAGGAAAPGRPWRVGVRDPFTPGAIVGAIRLGAGLAAATSGHYERFVEIGGVRYAHIIDPRTGRPVRGMAGVTVVCPTAVQTDAMSTSLFVLGVRDGLDVLGGMPECLALFIPDEQPMRILVTPGMREIFEPLPELAGAVSVVPPGQAQRAGP